jgi:hypothetical protein
MQAGVTPMQIEEDWKITALISQTIWEFLQKTPAQTPTPI